MVYVYKPKPTPPCPQCGGTNVRNLPAQHSAYRCLDCKKRWGKFGAVF